MDSLEPDIRGWTHAGKHCGHLYTFRLDYHGDDAHVYNIGSTALVGVVLGRDGRQVHDVKHHIRRCPDIVARIEKQLRESKRRPRVTVTKTGRISSDQPNEPNRPQERPRVGRPKVGR